MILLVLLLALRRAKAGRHEEACLDADDEPLTTDQRGQPRPETGDSMCDVGAFEVEVAP
jgi:hypothetical protein